MKLRSSNAKLGQANAKMKAVVLALVDEGEETNGARAEGHADAKEGIIEGEGGRDFGLVIRENAALKAALSAVPCARPAAHPSALPKAA